MFSCLGETQLQDAGGSKLSFFLHLQPYEPLSLFQELPECFAGTLGELEEACNVVKSESLCLPNSNPSSSLSF